MADVFTKDKRSKVMSRIRGRGNRNTEVAFARLLRTERITGWRRHYKITGTPDFAFPKLRVAVFIDGCFWHQCPKCSTMPEDNREFWESKLSSNVARDRRVSRLLRVTGWQVVRIWEHELRAVPPGKRLRAVVRGLKVALGSRGHES